MPDCPEIGQSAPGLGPATPTGPQSRNSRIVEGEIAMRSAKWFIVVAAMAFLLAGCPTKSSKRESSSSYSKTYKIQQKTREPAYSGY